MNGLFFSAFRRSAEGWKPGGRHQLKRVEGSGMKALLRFGILCLMVTGIWLPGSLVGAASVAVFPLQELGDGRNDANLPLTRMLVDELVAQDNEVVSLRTVVRFMAKNRIRGLGHLETPYIEQV